MPDFGKKRGENIMEINKINNLNTFTFVGIDSHREEHTACAINRFEEEKGFFNFINTQEGIDQFLHWLITLNTSCKTTAIGIEGGGTLRKALVDKLLNLYPNLYEVNPLYTKQRRDYGTRGDKSDLIDAKLVAEVLTRKIQELPKITKSDVNSQMVCLRKTVGFYEDLTKQRTRLKNQLKLLEKERQLTDQREELTTLLDITGEKKRELKRIQKIQQNLEIKLKSFLKNQGDNLTSIKGVSVILAAKLVAHSRGISRFPRIDKFIKYAGIAPCEKSSGKTKRHTKSHKGNRQLNTTFYLVALNQLRWNLKAKAYFHKKITEGKSKKHALRCLMKRVACIVYGMLKSGENYRE